MEFEVGGGGGDTGRDVIGRVEERSSDEEVEGPLDAVLARGDVVGIPAEQHVHRALEEEVDHALRHAAELVLAAGGAGEVPDALIDDEDDLRGDRAVEEGEDLDEEENAAGVAGRGDGADIGRDEVGAEDAAEDEDAGALRRGHEAAEQEAHAEGGEAVEEDPEDDEEERVLKEARVDELEHQGHQEGDSEEEQGPEDER